MDKKTEKLARRNEKLASKLEAERAAEAELASALKGSKRKPRLLRGAVIAGAAYVLGAKAGRARYEQIMRWAGSMKERVAQRAASDGTRGAGSSTDGAKTSAGVS